MEENNKDIIDMIEPTHIQEQPIENNKKNSSGKIKWIFIGLIIVVLIALVVFGVLFLKSKNNETNNETNNVLKYSEYKINDNKLSKFDLYFLQLENYEKNIVYSPLSIKYALGMLEDAADGDSKAQITNVIGEYKANKYVNSENMSFANAMFVKDTYKKNVKSEYISLLNEKYSAEVKYDSFKTPNELNKWVENRTLGLMKNFFNDVSEYEFILINALGIDMEWQNKFLENIDISAYYDHEDFGWYAHLDVVPGKFKNINDEISGMTINASFNNYDIVNDLGEENIRKTVKEAFIKYLEENPEEKLSSYLYGQDIKGLTDEQLMEKYLDKYIEEIDSNYGKKEYTTDFSLYTDDDVKVFAKDLKEYNGTTLQYIGIMPKNDDLKDYIKSIDDTKVNTLISNLKELKPENFTEGKVTKIYGYIPKFKFEYGLDLQKDLQKLGITNVFEQGKANLTNLTNDKEIFINKIAHKSNIEFTQEGIKASAVTEVGGLGDGGGFDYLYDIPVEKIDLTFDKPYMFIIRDKNTGEVWFAGTVYEPLLYKNDMTKEGSK